MYTMKLSKFFPRVYGLIKNKSYKLDGQAETIKRMPNNKIPKTRIAKKLKVNVSTVYKHLAKTNIGG